PASTEMKAGFKPDARRLSEEELEKLAGDPRMDEPDDSPRGPTREQRRELARLRQRADSFLLSQGAVAMIAGNGRGSMGTIFTSNGAPYNWTAKPVLPGLEMSSEDLNRLTRLLQAGQPVRVEMDVQNA